MTFDHVRATFLLMHVKKILFKFEGSGIAIAHIKYHSTKNTLDVVTPTAKSARCYTLPKGNLGVLTAKKQLLYVSRHKNPVAGCNFKSYI